MIRLMICETPRRQELKLRDATVTAWLCGPGRSTLEPMSLHPQVEAAFSCFGKGAEDRTCGVTITAKGSIRVFEEDSWYPLNESCQVECPEVQFPKIPYTYRLKGPASVGLWSDKLDKGGLRNDRTVQ